MSLKLTMKEFPGQKNKTDIIDLIVRERLEGPKLTPDSRIVHCNLNPESKSIS